MQIGIDSFAAAIHDPGTGTTIAPTDRLRNLVDEIFDSGDGLIVERNGIRDSISIANISRVSTSVRAARIHLFLSIPGKFGMRLSFAPKRTPATFSTVFLGDPIVSDLRARIINARCSA